MQDANHRGMLTKRDGGLPGGFLPHLDFERHSTYNQ
jgi:hypothetical protein